MERIRSGREQLEARAWWRGSFLPEGVMISDLKIMITVSGANKSRPPRPDNAPGKVDIDSSPSGPSRTIYRNGALKMRGQSRTLEKVGNGKPHRSYQLTSQAITASQAKISVHTFADYKNRFSMSRHVTYFVRSGLRTNQKRSFKFRSLPLKWQNLPFRRIRGHRSIMNTRG